MAARAGRNTGQAVGAGSDGFFGQGDADHVGKYQAAIGMHYFNGRFRAAQRGHDDRWLVFGNQRKVFGQPRVRRVGNEVGAPRADGLLWLRVARLRQTFGDLVHPAVELADRARIGCWKGTDDAGLARRQHQLRAGDQEHRRCKHRQAQRKGRGVAAHSYSVALKPEIFTASAQRRDSACA